MKTLIAILVVIFLANHTAAQNKAEVTGKIVTENSEGLLKIKTVAHNNSAIFRELNYTMVSVKKGKSGNSSNKQGGKFSIKPGETKTLSESAINLQKNDALKVFLLVKDEQTNLLVAKDSLEINADHFKSAVNFIPEKNIELSGLTIDDTKQERAVFSMIRFSKSTTNFPKNLKALSRFLNFQPLEGRQESLLVRTTK